MLVRYAKVILNDSFFLLGAYLHVSDYLRNAGYTHFAFFNEKNIKNKNCNHSSEGRFILQGAEHENLRSFD